MMRLLIRLNLKFLIVLYLLFTISGGSFADEGDDVYVPYPLVFAHGLASDKNTWNTTEGVLDEYYRKYEYVGDRFYFANYGKNTDRDIQALRGDLIGAISRAMNCFPTGYRSEKKVIVVNHSTGGIVTRLANNSRVHKTVFIGVPNRGFPGASAIVLLDNVRDSVLPPIISKYSSFWGMVAASRFRLTQNPLPSMFYRFTILYKLLDRLVSINRRFRILAVFVSPPNGRTIKQLILPERVTYEEEISGSHGIWYASERVFDELKPEDAFLNNNNLSVPQNRRVIRGQRDSWDFLTNAIRLFNFNYRDKLNFSYQDLQMAEGQGDGLITLYSQTYGIGGSNVKTYQVQASHIEETKQWRTILTAIDDEPPVVWAAGIQSEYRNSEWWKRADSDKYRIVIGIKEYFLADVEIIKCELDGVSIFGGKPYDRIGRDFLRTRDVHFGNNTYKLGPGRFYIEASITPGVHELRIKVRNPAGVESKEFKIKITRPEIWNLDYIDLGGGGGTYVFDIRERLRQEVRYVRRICPADEDFSGLDEGEFVRLPGGSKHFEIREGLLPVPGYPPRMKKFGIHAVPTTEWLNGYVVRTMLKISNAAVKLIYTDPTFIKPLVESGRIEGGEIKEEEGLVARIDFPMDNSLVRADIPVCGLACGEDFYRYILDYGKGDNPTEWLEIKTSYKAETSYTHPGKPLMEYGKSIDGNLGMWETGLMEYYYKKYPVDLSGTYTLRLRVFNRDGKIAEDRIKVVVGRVALNCMNNRIESHDGKVVLIVEEHSLNTHGAIMAIREVKKDIGIPEGWGIIGKIYEVIPKDIVFIKPVRLKMVYNGSEGLGLYGYSENKKEWVRFPSVWDKKREVIYTQLDLTGPDISYYALIRTSDNYAQDPVLVPDHSKTGPYSRDTLIYCDFERDLGTWHEMDKGWGAGLDLVNRENGGRCLEITNTRSPSHFASSIIKEPFNIKEYPIIKFDYKMMPDIKINIMVKTRDGKWYDIQFTDDPKIYWDVNITPIGKIEGIKPDNKWHTAEINLYRMLEPYTDEEVVERIIMADWDVTGFKELVFGNNRGGAKYYIDNFTIGKGYKEFTLGLPIISDKSQDYIIKPSPISTN